MPLKVGLLGTFRGEFVDISFLLIQKMPCRSFEDFGDFDQSFYGWQRCAGFIARDAFLLSFDLIGKLGLG